MRRALALLAATCLAGPVHAAIAASNLGTAAGSAVTSLTLSTTADSPSGSLVVLVWSALSATPTYTIADSAATPNTYATPIKFTYNTTHGLVISYANITSDLPAPCTVTASETSTQLIVTAVVTCASADIITSGQAISGGSFTGVISGNCTLVAGAATCTITGGSVVASGTATISSAIKITPSVSASLGVSALLGTGLATSSPLDVTGAGATGTGTTASVATGTLGQAAELVVGAAATTGSNSAYASNSPFTDLTAAAIAGDQMRWGFDIVAATTTVTYAPTWTTSRAFGANVWSFKGAGGAATNTTHNGMLNNGVGP